MPGDVPDRIVIRRRFDSPREAVFDEWADADGMRAWMCPGDIVSAEVELDLRVGGRFRITMIGPTRAYEHRGQFSVVDRPSRLAFTWISDSTDQQPTLVTIDLVELGANECELVLTHESIPRPDARDRHRGGWKAILDKLAQHVGAKRR